MIDLKYILEGRTVDVYDGSTDLTESMLGSGAKRVTVFSRKQGIETDASVRPYHALLEAADCVASVCVLNDSAIKVLVAMYPSAPRYVLVRLAPRSAWLLGFLGLLRRLVFGLVRIEGIAVLSNAQGRGRTYWLVLEQSGGFVHTIPVLPKAVGIPAFLEWLKEEKINYLILRFYEHLPDLHREAGDLDMLVSDEDAEKVKDYLKQHEHLASDDEGDIRIGLHSVSGEPGLIPYYSPPLARQMLEHAVAGPAESRIPAPKDALLSFMYHVLYHSKKGYASGIPSTLSEHTDNHPENDYSGVIAQMAKEQGTMVGTTMEEMDEYLAQEGWRPKLDTLAKIAETNAWVRDRFFSRTQDDLVGLAVFVLREWVLERNLLEEVKKSVESHGYTILRTKVFNADEKKYVANTLRGGTWGTNEDGSTDGLLPATVLVVVDLQVVKMPPTYAHGFERFRVRALKEDMRQKFDTDGLSSMHSTDNTQESWEYIEVCFPNDVEMIKKEARELSSKSKLFSLVYIFSPKYMKHALRHSLRSWLIRNFLE